MSPCCDSRCGLPMPKPTRLAVRSSRHDMPTSRLLPDRCSIDPAGRVIPRPIVIPDGLVRKPKTSKGIATRLYLSEATVKTRVNRGVNAGRPDRTAHSIGRDFKPTHRWPLAEIVHYDRW